MKPRLPVLLAFCLALATTGFFLLPKEASGDAKSELSAAVKRGAELWKKTWGRGGKACATCHTKGPNKLTAKKLNMWPKYDKFLKKVGTAQQKMAQMITKQGRGTAPALGSDDMNALEAYIKTR